MSDTKGEHLGDVTTPSQHMAYCKYPTSSPCSRGKTPSIQEL